MPVIIQQGKHKILAMPGVVVGISEEENAQIAQDQETYLRERNDKLTASLTKKDAEEKLKELLENMESWDV